MNVLQEDLKSVINWSLANNMALHEEKFELLCHLHNPGYFGHELPFSSECFTYDLSDGKTLDPVKELKDLGVIASDDGSWKSQIASSVSKGRTMAAWALGAFRARDKITMLHRCYVR